MEKKEFPLLEYDPSESAIVDANKIFKENRLSEYCILTWFQETIDKWEASGKIKKHIKLGTTEQEQWTYEFNHNGHTFALLNPSVGGPISAMNFECAIARGYTKFIAIGSAGILKSGLKVGKIVIIDSAIRDEGTSFHYLPPSRELKANVKIVGLLNKELKERKISYEVGKAWTTDAIFRETPEKIKLRQSEGAIIVEMEAASLIAIAKVKNVPLGYMVYCGDDVTGEEWDTRNEIDRMPIKERMIHLGCELLLKYN